MGVATRVPMGDRIRTQRRSAGLTQRALAAAVGVSPDYLSLIESDKRQIGGRLLRQIADELGVSTEAFTAVSRDRLAADLSEVSQNFSGTPDASAAELVAFSPKWAEIVLDLHDRSLTAEARSDHLVERFARDPQWISFAHDILSRITSIRSAAEILSDFRSMDEGQRGRFVETLATESARLTHVTRRMIDSLNEAATADAAGADVREVDAFLQDHGYYFAHLEEAVANLEPPGGDSASKRFQAALALAEDVASVAVETELLGHRFRTDGASRRARGALLRYAAGAILMPYEAFRATATATRYDIDAIGEVFGVSFEQVAHRLASLRRPQAEGVPFAFLRVDPAGTVSKRLSTPQLRLPLFGACPLWVVYEAFSQPGRTLSQMVDLDGERFILVARALEKAARRQAQPAARFAVMLGVPAAHADSIVYADAFASGRESVVTRAGYECRSCAMAGCAQRAHGASAA
ncbi:MAG: short-chain fatty acyl-CoA regulator family protein [Pseudomonadota bacterium]